MASPVAVVVASPAASAVSHKRKDVPAAVPALFVVSPVAAAPARGSHHKTVVSAPVSLRFITLPETQLGTGPAAAR